MNESPIAPASNEVFLTTRWTRVCLAKADSEDGRDALRDLCEAYYEPVVAFLRVVLRDADAAKETSHAFFEELLAGGRIGGATRNRGRFRSYLLGAVKHFVAHRREAAGRAKRGGGREAVPLDDVETQEIADAGQSYPDAAFDRQWAVTVIARSLETLRAECIAEGKGDFFELVADLLGGQGGHGDQVALAERCGMSYDAFRMAVSRLKKRLRACVKAEVAGTIDDPSVVQDEMETLFAALANR
jgi:RNA polymerase sigma-70 factor (ECF subfamily)